MVNLNNAVLIQINHCCLKTSIANLFFYLWLISEVKCRSFYHVKQHLHDHWSVDWIDGQTDCVSHWLTELSHHSESEQHIEQSFQFEHLIIWRHLMCHSDWHWHSMAQFDGTVANLSDKSCYAFENWRLNGFWKLVERQVAWTQPVVQLNALFLIELESNKLIEPFIYEKQSDITFVCIISASE